MNLPTPRRRQREGVMIGERAILLSEYCKTILFVPVYLTVERYFTHETTANLSVMPTSEAPAFAAFTACTRRDQAYKDDALEKYGLTRKGFVE